MEHRLTLQEEQVKRVQTPYRYPHPVLHGSGRAGAFDSKGVDCPFVFLHNGMYHMMYVGFDGIGYQTALAVSEDLLHWSFRGMVLKRQMECDRWDRVGGAGVWMIKESDSIWEIPRLKKIDGKYWLIYHAYPGVGYESGPAEIGLAWTKDERLLDWQLPQAPQLSWRDGADWEQGGLYKSCVVQQDGEYYMFYNAKNQKAEDWTEQIGVVRSSDLQHWKRERQHPVLPVSKGAWDGQFTADPYVVRDQDRWLMFYYGLGEVGADKKRHAQEGLAVSKDLLHWEKAEEPILTYGAPGSIDSGHAHKPAIFYQNGVLYHFYCATRPGQPGDPANCDGEYRTICVAASKPWPQEYGL